MKFLNRIHSIALVALASIMAVPAFGDATYPVTKPTYIPTAISSAATYSAPAVYSFTANGLSTVSLRVTGTCTSLAGTLQGSNDGSNWTAINLYPVGGGANISAISSTGFWRANASGFSKMRVNITALTASCTVAMAGTPGVPHMAADLCQDPSIAKSSAVVNVGASTTAALVAAVTGKTTYLCSFEASAVGTNPTMTFKYGTQVTNPCDTGATNLSGAMIPAAANGMVNLGAGHTITKTAASNQLCLTTGATTSIQGVATYVQQ